MVIPPYMPLLMWLKCDVACGHHRLYTHMLT